MQTALLAAISAYFANVDVVSSAKHVVESHAAIPTTDAEMVANDAASDARLQRVKVAA